MDNPRGGAGERPAGPERTMPALLLGVGLAFVLSLAGSALKSTVQVYLAAMAVDLHAGLSAFAWSTTTFAVVVAAASPAVGALADRFGGGAVLITGTVLGGLAFVGCSLSAGVAAFVPVYGVAGAAAFTMLSYVPLGKLADELFAGRGEGLAYAVMTNGPAVGFIVLVPLWVWLGTFTDWRAVFLGLGAVMLVVMTPVAVLVRRLSAEQSTSDAPAPRRRTLRERSAVVLGDRRFLLVAGAFMACGVTMAFVDVHMVADLSMAGMAAPVISGSLIALGALEIAGSLVAGRLCDRGRVKQTLVVGYALRGTAMLLLAATPTVATSLAFGAVFGASYMVTVVATTLWVARLVPPDVRGTAMGLVWALHGLGAALGSQVGAYIAQSSSYNVVSLAEGVVVLVALVIVLFLRDPSRRPVLVVTHDTA